MCQLDLLVNDVNGYTTLLLFCTMGCMPLGWWCTWPRHQVDVTSASWCGLLGSIHTSWTLGKWHAIVIKRCTAGRFCRAVFLLFTAACMYVQGQGLEVRVLRLRKQLRPSRPIIMEGLPRSERRSRAPQLDYDVHMCMYKVFNHVCMLVSQGWCVRRARRTMLANSSLLA